MTLACGPAGGRGRTVTAALTHWQAGLAPRMTTWQRRRAEEQKAEPETRAGTRTRPSRRARERPIWKVGSCDITWYIPYWLVYTTFVISVVISVQSGVIYHEIWKHRRWNITWYITCDEEAHACYIACYMPRNMVWYILELCL